jgi:hypothetical protein
MGKAVILSRLQSAESDNFAKRSCRQDDYSNSGVFPSAPGEMGYGVKHDEKILVDSVRIHVRRVKVDVDRPNFTACKLPSRLNE